MKTGAKKKQAVRTPKDSASAAIIYKIDPAFEPKVRHYDADQSEALASKLEKWAVELRAKARFQRMLESPKSIALS